jgi:hypothetical protein
MRSFIGRILVTGVQLELILFLLQRFRLGQDVDLEAVVVLVPLALVQYRLGDFLQRQVGKAPVSAMKALQQISSERSLPTSSLITRSWSWLRLPVVT